MKGLSSAFLKGLFVVLPVAVSIQLVLWMATAVESWLASPLEGVLGRAYVPGMALLLIFVLTVVIGLSSRWPTADFVWGMPGRLLERLPVVGRIYGTTRDIMDIMGDSHFGDESVVLVELPNLEMSLIGIVTVHPDADASNAIANHLKDDQLAVYLPMSYQVGGYTVIVPRAQTTPLPISPTDAMQLVLSAGVVSDAEHGNGRKKSPPK